MLKLWQSADGLSGYDLLTIALVVGALTAIVAILRRVILRRQRWLRTNSPRRLFDELCQAHHLSRPQRSHLWELARRNHPAEPARVFLEPSLFAEPGDNRQKMSTSEIAVLPSKLFGDNHPPLHGT